MGALFHYITQARTGGGRARRISGRRLAAFQPMKANFGSMPDLDRAPCPSANATGLTPTAPWPISRDGWTRAASRRSPLLSFRFRTYQGPLYYAFSEPVGG